MQTNKQSIRLSLTIAGIIVVLLWIAVAFCFVMSVFAADTSVSTIRLFSTMLILMSAVYYLFGWFRLFPVFFRMELPSDND